MAKKWKIKQRIPLSQQEKPYHSITYGKVTEKEMFDIIVERMKDSERDHALYVGTDSQTHNGTKVVTVIAILEIGKGGFWFHSVDWTSRLTVEQIRVKIYNETMRSIDMAKKLTETLYENDLDFEVIIHVDLGKGKYSKTKEMISEIIGWVNAEGFQAHAKPESWAASTIADRISK